MQKTVDINRKRNNTRVFSGLKTIHQEVEKNARIENEKDNLGPCL